MTRRQKQLLDFIGLYQSENNGVSPSFDEMREALGYKSKSGIHRVVIALKELGFIEYANARARSITIIGGESQETESLRIDNERLYNFIDSKGLLSEYETWRKAA